MIECPNCKTSFSPSYRFCPRCKEHPAPFAERRNYLRRRSQELATEGSGQSEIRQFLINEGLADIDADTFVRESIKIVRAENRSYGCLRLVAGIAMLLFGTLVLAVLAASVTRRIPVMLAGRAVIAFLVVGVTLIFTGILAILSGIFATTTGK